MKKLLRYTWALIRQYCLEIFVFIYMVVFLVLGNALCKGNILALVVLVLMDIIICAALYFIILGLTRLISRMFAKIDGELLQLVTRNEICMKPRNIKDEGAFFRDFADILVYCREKGIVCIYARTHRILVLHILHRYRIEKYNANKYLDEFKVGETKVVDTKFGKVEITYKGKIISGCNRYNKKIKNWWERVFKETDGYKVVIHLKEGVVIKQ